MSAGSAAVDPAPLPVLSPVNPRLRLLLLAVRQALYIVADALGDYCGQPRKAVR